MRLLGLIVLLISVATAPAAETVLSFRAKASLGEKHQKATLFFSADKLAVSLSSGAGREFAYDDITGIVYTYAKAPRGKAAIGVGILCIPCGVGLAFTKKKRHWLTVEAEGQGAVALELDKKSWQQVAAELDARARNASLERLGEVK